MASLIARLAAGLALLLWALTLGADLAGAMLGGRGSIVFTSDRAGQSDLYLLDLDRGFIHRLTAHQAEDVRANWSFDGRLGFSSNRDGSWKLYVVGGHEATVRPLTTSTGRDSNPAWSPDGTRIAFDSTRHGNLELYVMPADCPACAPDRLTRYAAIDQRPRWSPDGRWLAFESIRFEYRDIFLIDPDCAAEDRCPQTLRRLTTNHISDWAAAWSPDSAQIVFVSNRGAHWDLYIMDADCDQRPEGCEANARRAVETGRDDNNPDWSPDGRYLIFESWMGENWDLFLLDLACPACPPQQITFGPANQREAAWWPR